MIVYKLLYFYPLTVFKFQFLISKYDFFHSPMTFNLSNVPVKLYKYSQSSKHSILWHSATVCNFKMANSDPWCTFIVLEKLDGSKELFPFYFHSFSKKEFIYNSFFLASFQSCLKFPALNHVSNTRIIFIKSATPTISPWTRA